MDSNLKTLIVVIAIVLASCGVTQSPTEHRIKYEKDQTMVIEIDKCEYILYSTMARDGGVCIIHKANCKNHD